VPTDLSQANKPCSICQEKFEVEWHKELEQPVWKDAIKVGQKYYHASCYAEVQKGNAAAASASAYVGSTRNSARSTPEAVLGKRTFDHFKHDTHDS
jgi:pre-mRNA cleavage complex 2 protein Pcf11